MQKRSFLPWLASLALLAGLLACSPSNGGTPADTAIASPTSPPAATSASPSATVPPPTEAARGGTSPACTNSLYPVATNGSWQYAGTSSLTGDFSFTRTFPEVHADGFTDQDVWNSGVTRTGQWNCDNGNLKSLSLGAGAGTVSASDLNFVANSTTSEGVTIPATINAGGSWSQTIRIDGTLTIADGSTADATNEASMDCAGGGTESVTVPAGTFDATKVECQVQMTITVTMTGVSIPPTAINSTSTAWYAPNVGWIKSVETSDVGSDTIELQSYSIP